MKMPVVPNKSRCFCEPGPGSGIFQDYCQILYPGDILNLCELNVQKPTAPYYITISGDGPQPVMVCALEKFIDDTHGAGRKTDFLIAGQNPCKTAPQIFVVFLELRDQLISVDQWDDKKLQCIQATQLLCKDVTNYMGLHEDSLVRQLIANLNYGFQHHRVAAAVIPALYSRPRALGNQAETIGRKPVRVMALPDHLFKKPVTWKQLLKAMGLVNC